MKSIPLIMVSLLTLTADMGYGAQAPTPWAAEHVVTQAGFKVPECALHEPSSGTIFVSNIESEPDAYWADDGKGYLSALGTDHRVKAERWIDSDPACLLHAPKGITVLGPHLYFADNTRLMRCTLQGDTVEVVLTGMGRANDLCTDGTSVWVSDTLRNRVVIYTPHGETRAIPAPEGINGLTFFKGKLFGVSWTVHEIFELDPTGKQEPVAFGLAEHFTNLDAIEVLDDGTFLVSDFTGDKISTVSPDRTTVQTLIEIPTPADFGLNRKEGRLYIPLFMHDKLAVYQLTRGQQPDRKEPDEEVSH